MKSVSGNFIKFFEIFLYLLIYSNFLRKSKNNYYIKSRREQLNICYNMQDDG